MLIHVLRGKHSSKTVQAAAVFIMSLIYQLLKFIFYLYDAEYCFYAHKDVAFPFDKADECLTGWKPEVAVTGQEHIQIEYLSLATLEVVALCLRNTLSWLRSVKRRALEQRSKVEKK